MSDLTADTPVDTPDVDPAPVDTPEVGGENVEPDYSGWTVEQAVGELRKVRSEAASHRVKAKEFEEKLGRFSKFDGLDDADFNVFADVVNRYKTGDFTNTADMLRQMADSLSPAQRGEAAQAAGAAVTDAPMTRAEFEKAMAEREQQQQMADAQRELDREATELGYGPDSIYYLPLMRAAHEQAKVSGRLDLRAAAEQIQKARDAEIAGYLESKKKDAERQPAAGAPGGGAAGGKSEQPKSLADAHRAMKARVAAAVSANGGMLE